MADVAFDLLGDASIHNTPAQNSSSIPHSGTGAILREEEDAFSAAVSVWRGIFIKRPTNIYPRHKKGRVANPFEPPMYIFVYGT